MRSPCRAGCCPSAACKQKVLAAHRAGLTEVVLPVRNGPDLEDVPEGVREQMTFHLAEEIGEVLTAALGEPGAAVGTGREALVDVVAAA